MRVTVLHEGSFPETPEGFQEYWVEIGDGSHDRNVAMFTMRGRNRADLDARLAEIGAALVRGEYENGMLTAPRRAEDDARRQQEGFPF